MSTFLKGGNMRVLICVVLLLCAACGGKKLTPAEVCEQVAKGCDYGKVACEIVKSEEE